MPTRADLVAGGQGFRRLGEFSPDAVESADVLTIEKTWIKIPL